MFEGVLQGFDNSTNIIISSCIERIIYPEKEEENQEIPLGLYVMRGGNIVCVGEIDTEADEQVDWKTLKGADLKNTKNPL